jgi:DNA-binding transcriptional LysR family regulator
VSPSANKTCIPTWTTLECSSNINFARFDAESAIMSMEPARLRTFVAVAEELNFRRAAERLNIAQPALSRAIRKLEDEVGCPLLLRTTRRVELTEAGRVMLETAREAVNQADAALRSARDAASGQRTKLTLAYTHASISGPLPQIVTAFRLAEPQVRLDMQELWTDGQALALLERRVDVGFAMPPMLRKEFDFIEVKTEPWVVVMREDHPLAEQAHVHLEALREERFVVGTIDRWRHFREMIAEVTLTAGGFVPRISQEEREIHAILGLVASGAGITLYPDCIRSYHRIGLAVRPIAGDLPPVRTLCAWRRDNPSPALRRFVAKVHAHLDPGLSLPTEN